MGDLKFEAIKKIAETNFKVRDLSKISMINSLSPPSVFIGSRLKYPEINVGILSPLEKDENAWVYDDAKYWAENNFEINQVLHLRNSLLNSRFRTKVTDARMNKKFMDLIKDVAISSKPVEVEIELKNRIRSGNEKDKILTPLGMSANFEKAKIIGNVQINRHLDKILNDELKVSDSMKILYENNFDEYSLSKILSVGVLGLKKDRRLVPTRWSITASDDILGKQLLKKVRDYKWLEDYELFYEEFMGNQYLILMFPNIWSFELFELYFPGSSWNPSAEIKASTDFEGFDGRTKYAFNTAGGYYAARLPILKYLDSIKKQASVVVIRIETPSYWASLGVWVVRESVKKALNKKIKFSSKKELLDSAKGISKIKYQFDTENIFKTSKLIRSINLQRNLTEYF
ncbi:MAG TPA: hypothetical protein VJA20_00650 [Candidatus Nanoarchaeia archaeon]|nr:hypothetical protein [Candidatus Nanoarchaeia archaeon]